MRHGLIVKTNEFREVLFIGLVVDQEFLFAEQIMYIIEDHLNMGYKACISGHIQWSVDVCIDYMIRRSLEKDRAL